MTMETKVTSKTSSLRALLLRAWRERWTDLQWGIQIKTVLPRGVSGDVYNLADCILQQALVGPGPNQLVLSYLKHSLSSQLVSYAAVLQRISKYDGFHKPHCIISLLEFLETIQNRITCRGKPDEGLLLAASVLSVVHWLLTCILHALNKLAELKNSPEHVIILEKPVSILNEMLKCDFMVAMLYLAKQDDRDLYHEVIKKCKEVETLLSQASSFKPSVSMEETLRKLHHLDPEDQENGERSESVEPVTYCLQPLLTVEVLLNPSSDTQVFVNEILMVQRLKGYSMQRLYCEVMRACLISLNDVLGTNEESQWGAFTLLKIPLIMKQLHVTVNGETGSSAENTGFSQDVVDSFELLLQYTPLLDIIDAKCSCNCMECLLNELLKVGLVTEKNVEQYTKKRVGLTVGIQKSDQAVSQTTSIPNVIIRAEPTLVRILKTLDADYSKVQDALLGVLCHVLTGKSFELILAVATVEGKLRTFVNKLIKFNEFSKQMSEGTKVSQTRAMLFDISFLMLCSIVQTYGSEVVLSEESGDSFFVQWVRECMVENGRAKSPDLMLERCDPAIVDALLSQFNSADCDLTTSIGQTCIVPALKELGNCSSRSPHDGDGVISTVPRSVLKYNGTSILRSSFRSSSQVKWNEVCLHIPAAIKEVLLAWENGALLATDVKRILDAMRSRMCCLPVCAAAWLCSYMQILHLDALLKPMNMVQQFLTSVSNEELSQQDNYKERSGLMFQIIRKMQYDVHPPTHSKTKAMSLSHSIISTQPISEQLESVWASVHQRGWVTIEATHTLESLLNTGGSQWFVTNLVKEVLKFRYREDLDRAVDLAFAVFHLDIEHCTLALLLHTLPQYFHNQLKSEELVEPQASALAKLCAYCVFAAVEFQNNSTSSQGPASRKRNRCDLETEDLNGVSPIKILRLAPAVPEAADATLVFGGTSSVYNTTQPIKDPLHMALSSLFQAFSVIVQDGEVSQQTHFVFKFLEFAVKCGRDRTRLVLQVMPNTLVPCLLRSFPDLFTTDLLLKLYDIQIVHGRKATARDLCLLRNMMLRPSARDIMQT